MQTPNQSSRFDVVLITGKTVSLSRQEVTSVFLHPWILLTYSALSLITVAMNQQPWTQGMPLWLRVAIYFLSSVVGLSVAWMTLIMLSWTVVGRILRRVPSIIFDLTGAFASLLTTYCLVIFQRRSINISSISSVFLYVFYIVIIVHVSIFLWSVIIPKILHEIRSRDDFLALKPIDEILETDETPKHEESVRPVQNSSDENRTVVVGNSRIPLTSIQHISAEGNYVRVHTSNSNYFEAGTMKMVLSQVPVNLGLRTHRSHWVSYSAIHSVESDGRTLKVNLASGVQVPVSRSNLDRVKRLASPDNTVECN